MNASQEAAQADKRVAEQLANGGTNSRTGTANTPAKAPPAKASAKKAPVKRAPKEKLTAKQIANRRLLRRWDGALKAGETNISTIVALSKKIEETDAWQDAVDANGVAYPDWQTFFVDSLSHHKVLYALLGPALVKLMAEKGCSYDEIKDVTTLSKAAIGKIINNGRKPSRQDNTPEGKAKRAVKSAAAALEKIEVADIPAADMNDWYHAVVLHMRAIKEQAKLNGVTLTEPDTAGKNSIAKNKPPTKDAAAAAAKEAA